MKPVDLACVCEVESNLIEELDVEFVDGVKHKKNSRCPKIQFLGHNDTL
jgi:hypothetical protein